MVNEISAISVFLFFLTFLFNSIDSRTTTILEERVPERTQHDKLRKYLRKLNLLIFLNALPTTLVYLATTYLLFPDCLNILKKSTFSLCHFDVLATLFIFIELGLLGFAIYALTRTIELLIHRNNIK